MPVDYEEAFKWFKLAAGQGHPGAQHYLGYCYDEGKGVEQNLQLAVEWYTKAAEQGHETAQNNLGV